MKRDQKQLASFLLSPSLIEQFYRWDKVIIQDNNNLGSFTDINLYRTTTTVVHTFVDYCSMMFYLHEARAKQGSLIPNETFNRKELKERLE